MASKNLSFNELKSLINDKKLGKLLLLTGEEDYYCEYAVNHIKSGYISKGSEQMDYVKINFESKGFDLDKVADNVMLPPWMSEKRVILVRNSGIFEMNDPKKELSDSFSKFAESIPDSSLVIFWDDRIDKRKKALLGVFEKQGNVCDCPKLNDADIAGRLAQNFSKHGLTIDQDASDSLISRTDRSMRAIAGELNKIVMYCREKNIKNIDYDVVDALCPPDVKGSIFTMLDSVSAGDTATALLTLNNLIALKEPEVLIKYRLAKHITQLICAKELKTKDKIVQRLGVHPFTAKKLAAQAPKFEMDKLLYLFSMCAKTEYECRQGKMDDRQSLEILLVLACKSLT